MLPTADHLLPTTFNFRNCLLLTKEQQANSLINRLLVVHPSWLMTQGSWGAWPGPRVRGGGDGGGAPWDPGQPPHEPPAMNHEPSINE